jgi:hypothetical protein
MAVSTLRRVLRRVSFAGCCAGHSRCVLGPQPAGLLCTLLLLLLPLLPLLLPLLPPLLLPPPPPKTPPQTAPHRNQTRPTPEPHQICFGGGSVRKSWLAPPIRRIGLGPNSLKIDLNAGMLAT